MSVPALITVSGAIVAASPAALGSILAMYAANIAVRSAYDKAVYDFNNSSEIDLDEIVWKLQEIKGVLDDSLLRPSQLGVVPEDERGIAEVLYQKVLGLQDCTLQINAVDPTQLQDYAETWTMF